MLKIRGGARVLNIKLGGKDYNGLLGVTLKDVMLLMEEVLHHIQSENTSNNM